MNALSFSTDEWGSEQRPSLTAFAMSPTGDTFVSCTITDGSGKLSATDRKEMADASAVCLGF